MRAGRYLPLLVMPLIVGLCTGCAGTGKSFGKVGKVFSPVTGVFKGTANRVASGVKDTGSAAAGDVRHYTTKIPGSTRTSLTASQQHAIANYEMKKQYQAQIRKYNLESRLVPKNAKVHVSY